MHCKCVVAVGTSSVVAAPMPVVIFTCGTRSAKRRISGAPEDDLNILVKINAKTLPNPYSHVLHLKGEERLAEVRAFLLRENEQRFNTLVAKGVAAVNQGRHVIVQCLHGKDRSRVVAQEIERQCGPGKAVVVQWNS